ncbi:unnamed protein product [Symbiodinium microadriaticum]|nr:unnamed protein product [Symbiodinium microadriaticum]
MQAGPWEVLSASQALDFDIVNTCRDHVPLRVSSIFRCPRRQAPQRAARRCTQAEVKAHGASVWARVRKTSSALHGPAERVSHFLKHHHEWCSNLPTRAPLVVRQPYVCQRTVQALFYLRDWRCQVRQVHKEHQLWHLRRAVTGWRGGRLNAADMAAMRDTQRLLAALQGQEARLARRVHALAKRDKQRHFLTLTNVATVEWHNHGRPTEAIQKLRWASRRAAERRAVHAAGGYDIDAQLEEQFRAQEGGRQATPGQAQAAIARWLATPTCPCHSALPSKLDLEFACHHQKVGKAPGPDAVTNAFWAYFPAYAGEWLWEVCTRIALAGRESAHFKAALVCALYKKGPAALPQNYRSIALWNGVAKLWHGHLRRTIGGSVLQPYNPLQLGGRRGIPVGFAVATYRAATGLSIQGGRSLAVLFIDIQAAYYEASRSLVFTGGALDDVPDFLPHQHLQALATELLHTGALERLGVPTEERALLHDCVSCSYWRLVSSDRLFLATRGSRPGDGLADIIFGALFAIALRHIRWADDLALITVYESPAELLQLFPAVAGIALSTLQALKFSVNLGAGKTEALLDIRGPGAKQVRKQLLAGASCVPLGAGLDIRVAPEYRYLGVVQTPHDTGRRDIELSAQRAYGAWAHGRTLLSSTSVPWALRVAWLAGRILPAAYATLATSIATSARAWAPLEGFFEKAVRTLSGSWTFGHLLSKPTLLLLAGLSAPSHAADIARVRLVVQLVTRSMNGVLGLKGQGRVLTATSATAAQRAAALEGRLCSQTELDQELFAATGVSDVYQWAGACPVPAAQAPFPPAADASADASVVSPLDPLCPSLHHLPSPLTCPIQAAPCGRWFALHDCSAVRSDNWQVPSPRWEGLLRDDFACQLPSSWHRYWRCWHAAIVCRPWSSEFYRHTKLLHSASAAPPQGAGTGPPEQLLDLLAATVSLRIVADAVRRSGLLWIRGSPSRAGLTVVRSLLPAASFHFLWTPVDTLFVVAHPTCAPPWRRALSDLFSVSPVGRSPRILQVRATVIYRTRSQDVG